MKLNIYQSLLSSRFSKQWKRIGTRRRSGVAVPLFSVYSRQSIGIGEIPDLKLLIDWCASTQNTILQLFPMNDVGFNFRPYDAESSFAIDPMYLSVERLENVPPHSFKKEIAVLRKKFPCGGPRVNYGIKKAKLELLKKIFSEILRRCAPQDDGISTIREFKSFREKNKFWLRDYSRFRVLKDKFGQKSWEEWNAGADAAGSEEALFYEWLQWQVFEQFTEVKRYARKKNIFLKGDLPFLVSRDSADVWAFKDCFKLELAAGAPPDLYFAKGQRWGMPPYDWEKIEARGYDYLIEKLKYAENFYDLFRIDHFVGIFRIWAIRHSEPLEHAGAVGQFDPADESRWEEHGKKILDVIAKNTKMLPCAEDLGTVPGCSARVLEEYGLPGLDVQRWTRDWDKSYDFIAPEKYRPNSVATLSTHDMAAVTAWWNFFAGSVDEDLFEIKCGRRGVDFEKVKPALFDDKRSAHGRLFWKENIGSAEYLAVLGLRQEEALDFMDIYLSSFDERKKFLDYIQSGVFSVRKALEKVQRAASVFGIQLLQDWFSLDRAFKGDAWEFRINFPGTMGNQNWTLVMPVSLDKMKSMPINKTIREINRTARRI